MIRVAEGEVFTPQKGDRFRRDSDGELYELTDVRQITHLTPGGQVITTYELTHVGTGNKKHQRYGELLLDWSRA